MRQQQQLFLKQRRRRGGGFVELVKNLYSPGQAETETGTVAKIMAGDSCFVQKYIVSRTTFRALILIRKKANVFLCDWVSLDRNYIMQSLGGGGRRAPINILLIGVSPRGGCGVRSK
jgi:hypothetical protein